MNRCPSRLIWVILLLLGPLGCGSGLEEGGESRWLTYLVEGTGARCTVEFLDGDGVLQRVEDVAVPWSRGQIQRAGSRMSLWTWSDGSGEVFAVIQEEGLDRARARAASVGPILPSEVSFVVE